jgi:hypothetical protein
VGRAPSQWQDPVTATPSIVQVLFGPRGDDIPGDGLEYCGPTATAMAIYYLYNNGFTQLAPAPYGGQEDPLAINLELVLSGLMGTSVDVEQSGTPSLASGTIQGSVSIADIGQTTAEPGGVLQGGGTIAGTAEIGGVIQCGPDVGLITLADSVVISSDCAFFWQLQGPYDNSNSQPGTGWNALEFQSTSTTVGSSTEPVRVFLDFSIVGGDLDTANQQFWENALTWTLATFPEGTSPSCYVEHGNFIYNSGCFCVCVQGSSLNLLWQPGATSANWCTSSS